MGVLLVVGSLFLLVLVVGWLLILFGGLFYLFFMEMRSSAGHVCIYL
jgi:hypothetical protein